MNHSGPTSVSERPLPLPPVTVIPNSYEFQTVALREVETLNGHSTSYKKYDSAIVSWLSRRFSDDLGNSMPVIPSPPQNAFANYKRLLSELNLAKDCQPGDMSSQPLPMISCYRNGEDPREGGTGGFPIRNMGFTLGPKRFTGTTRYPKPMWFKYQVSLWAREQSHQSWMKHVMELSFVNRVGWTRVAHGPDGLKRMTAIHRENSEDLTNFSRSETEDRLLRTVYNLKVEAWMWDDVLASPVVLKVLVANPDGDLVHSEVFSQDYKGPILPDSGPPESVA